MTLSKLEIEILILTKHDCREGYREYYGPDEGFEAWRVIVNGEIYSERAHPFSPIHNKIQLETNPCFHYFDGGEYVRVRQLGEMIFWFGTEKYGWIKRLPHLWVVAFNKAYYESVLSNLVTTDYLPSYAQPTLRRIPSLSTAELAQFLEFHFPETDEAIYVVPPIEDDLLGARTLRRIRSLLYSTEKLLQNPIDLRLRVICSSNSWQVVLMRFL